MRKNRLIYISFTILAWVFVYFYGGRIPYMLAYMVIFIPLVSLVQLLISYNFLMYSQRISSRMPMKGDNVEYIEYFANESIVPCCYIEVKYFSSKHLTGYNSKSKSFWFSPFQKSEEIQHIQFAHRGFYEFGANEIIFTDLLGIFKIRRTINETIKVRVVPKIYDVTVPELFNEINLEAEVRNKRYYEDVSLFEDVRKYQYGDSMKRVHWKLSAKNQELLVKNYNGISKNRVTILIDMQQRNGENENLLFCEDRIIECSLSMAKYFCDKYEQVQVIFFEKGILNNIEISNPEEFMGLYNVIALMDFNSGFAILDLTKTAILNNISSGNIFIVSASLDTNFLGELLEISLKGFDTRYILCETSISADEERLIEDIKSQGAIVVDSSAVLNSRGV